MIAKERPNDLYCRLYSARLNEMSIFVLLCGRVTWIAAYPTVLIATSSLAACLAVSAAGFFGLTSGRSIKSGDCLGERKGFVCRLREAASVQGGIIRNSFCALVVG